MYDLVIERYGKSEPCAEALWAAARLRDELDRDEAAASLYEELVERFPSFDRVDAALYNGAWATRDGGNEERAYELFARIHQDHPQSDYWADATYRLAQRAFHEGDYDRAGALSEKAMAAMTDAAIRERFLYLLGQVRAVEHKWDEARGAFDTLVVDYPQSSLRRMAEYGSAEAVFRLGDYEEAGRLLRKLCDQSQGREASWLAIVHLRLAQSLAHSRQWAEAYEVASAIEARYPGFAEQYEADYVVGRCLASRADFEAARQAYGRVIRSPGGAKSETAAKSQLMIAESHFHQKSYDAALRDYLRLEILYDYPQLQAAALLQAGKCHALLGEERQAADVYGRLLKVYPHTDAAEQAARHLGIAPPRDRDFN
jgi:TolA-binding protein